MLSKQRWSQGGGRKGNRVGKSGSDQVWSCLLLCFYLQKNGKLLEGFEQRRDMIWCMLLAAVLRRDWGEDARLEGRRWVSRKCGDLDQGSGEKRPDFGYIFMIEQVTFSDGLEIILRERCQTFWPEQLVVWPVAHDQEGEDWTEYRLVREFRSAVLMAEMYLIIE